MPSDLTFIIRKTCPRNKYPHIPHFYSVKLGYAGAYLFFLFLLQNIDCGSSNEYPQSVFWSKNKENIKIFLLKFSSFATERKNLYIAWASVFVMIHHIPDVGVWWPNI